MDPIDTLTITDADGDEVSVTDRRKFDASTGRGAEIEVMVEQDGDPQTVWLSLEQALHLGRALVRMAAA